MALPLSPSSMSPQVPRSTLTHPGLGVSNGGYDNENNDLILWPGCVLQPDTSDLRYIVSDMLGQGTFGQVAKCVCQQTGEVVAVKVIKNQTAFYHQARVEVGVLQFLSKISDPEDQHHLVRMQDFFVFKDHLCLVFELLNLNLYELIKQNQFRGLSMRLIRIFLSQILDALCVLRNAHIVHCDLKPENVLLKGQAGQIKVIDFGSACFENRTMYSYIQSRFYRSPEVLLGHAYDMAIDMWSLGCMAAELFLGLPLFPGASEHDLLVRIVDMLGMPPHHFLQKAQHTNRYFRRVDATPSPMLSSSRGSSTRPSSAYVLRSQSEFEALFACKAPAGKRYFQHTKLADIIGAYPVPSGLDDHQVSEERQHRESFLDFLLGILDLDPDSRWTPKQALQHPFITRAPFTGPFQPSPESPMRAFRDHPSPIAVSSSQASIGRSPYPSGAPAPPPAPSLGALATSPEVHAQAHLAALAAVAQLTPPSSFAPASGFAPSTGSYPAAYQAVMQQLAPTMSSNHSQHQQHILSQANWVSGSVDGGYQAAAAAAAAAASESASSSLMPQQTPFGSQQAWLLMQQQQLQQQQQYSSFGSFSQGSAVLPSALQAAPHSLMPMGSLEALRGGWHAPRGRNAYGDMYGSSLTVPSRQLSLAGSLAGSAGAGSMGPPRLPPSLNSHRRPSFSSSPAGPLGTMPSPGMATASPRISAAAPNRVYGFGSSTPADYPYSQAQQPALPRQQSGQSRQQASPYRQSQHGRPSSGSIDHLLDEWAEQGVEGAGQGTPSRQASLEIPNPGDWDPNFSEEQLLEDSSSLPANEHGGAQLQTGWLLQDRASQRSSTNLARHASGTASSQASPVTPQAGYASTGHQQTLQQSAALEQLSHQLPGSFASMSTSFASPQLVQGAPQASLGPHDPAWFREGQVSQAQVNIAYQGSLLQQQQQQAHSLQPHAHMSPAYQDSLQQQQPAQSVQPDLTPQQQQLLLFAAQQQVMREQGVEPQWDEQQHQQQQLLLAALQPHRDATSSLQQQLDLSEGAVALSSHQNLLPTASTDHRNWMY